MVLRDRVRRYTAIENFRGRPLIVYATSTRLGVSSHISGDAVRELIDQIDVIPTDQDSVDIVIHSAGGDALAAWKLMSILRERFDTVCVLVPYMAFSAATLFCLGADEIVMHPHASLGPIDPQITIRQADGQQRGFSFEDVGAFLRFLKEEIGLSEQQHTTQIVEKLLSVVDAVHVGGAKRASELSTDVGERLLTLHMTNSDEHGRAREIAEGLNKSFFAHGDAVSRKMARSLQLKVAEDNEELERLLWDAYLGLESYLAFRTPFRPLQHFLDQAPEGTIAAPSPLVLPPNAPEQLVQQLWNQVATSAIQNLSNPAVEVDQELVHAVVESPRRASEFRTNSGLTATRMAGGEIRITTIERSATWVAIEGDHAEQGDTRTMEQNS
jgi:hypothetical protein